MDALTNSYWLVALKVCYVKTGKDKIVLMVKPLILKLVILRRLSHNNNKIITHNPSTGDTAIIDALVTIQSFFLYIHVYFL